MNPVEQVMKDELEGLLERLASSVPGGCLATVSAGRPALRTRLEEAEDRLAGLRVSLIEDYGRWRRALEDLENLWAVAAWRSAAEEPAEQAGALAA